MVFPPWFWDPQRIKVYFGFPPISASVLLQLNPIKEVLGLESAGLYA